MITVIQVFNIVTAIAVRWWTGRNLKRKMGVRQSKHICSWKGFCVLLDYDVTLWCCYSRSIVITIQITTSVHVIRCLLSYVSSFCTMNIGVAGFAVCAFDWPMKFASFFIVSIHEGYFVTILLSIVVLGHAFEHVLCIMLISYRCYRYYYYCSYRYCVDN